MNEKITIIEGPPPTFEAVNDGWVLGLNETPDLGAIAVTRLRTFNGPSLVERCHRAWRDQESIQLEFRDQEGIEHKAPIVAARYVEMDEGQILILWVRLASDEVEIGYDSDIDDDVDDESDDLLGQ